MKSLWLKGLTVAAWGVFALGCYNPKIEEGAFLCGANESCPDGFKCYSGRCRKKADTTTPQPDAGGGTPDTAQTILPPSGCWGNLCAMTPASGCDPVCQTGCKCSQKCAITNSGPACEDVTTQPKAVNAECDSGADICRAGSVCLEDQPGNNKCGSHCYRLCRRGIDADCGPEMRCLSEVTFENNPTVYGLCSPPVELCNPATLLARCRGDRNANYGCYILSQREPDLTVCECAGDKAERAPCERYHECRPGLECVRINNESICRQLCTPPDSPVMPASPCRNPATPRCQPFGNGKRFGYCMPA